jgi:spermidine synthase
MTQPFEAPPTTSPSSISPASRYLPVLLLLFAGSGCAALIYEIVWFQMLQLAIGATAVSMGFLLAGFMGGLCIGSLWFPRLSRYLQIHPLRIYAALEAGIGLLGLVVLWGFPLFEHIYIAGFQTGLSNQIMRAFLAAICLLPPTILMGASLPAIARWIELNERGASWWGWLYGTNTLGAVAGCLLAGFYLLRLFNLATATYAAVVVNLAVAALAYLLASRTPAHGGALEESPAAEEGSAQTVTAEAPEAHWPVYLTIAMSGAGALGAEVVWTRLMGMLLGSTVYVFSIILAVFLVGIAIGSVVAAWISRTVKPRLALGWCQVLLCGAIAWTAYMIADSLPYWPINPMLSTSPWQIFQIDMARCLWAILPPTILWGASFPLALAAVVSRGKSHSEDAGRIVGGVYAANTVGAIVGALSVSLILVPSIGTQQTQRVVLIVSALSALILLGHYAWQNSARTVAVWLTLSMIAIGFLTASIDPVPGELIAYGRRIAISLGQSKLLYTVEGRNSSVAITQWSDGATEIDVNGHVEATTEAFDMKLQRMVGHLPALLHPNPKSVLGIGFGAGVSAGTFTRYPGIEHITVCEIEPVIPPTSTKYFGKQDYEVYLNPKTHVVFDDARHYLLTTQEKYDVIASDPLDVFVKGTAAIYSKEYFDMVKAHLNPGGYFSLYVPLYETDEPTFKSELETFFASFPNATIWANTRSGAGYDMVFMGQMEPLKINVDEIQQRLSRPDYAPVVESLAGVGVNSAIELFATYAGRKSDLGLWSAGAELNTDADLRLQYLGGWGINSQLEDYLYRQMMRYRKVPQDIFTGSPETMQQMVNALLAGPGAVGQ